MRRPTEGRQVDISKKGNSCEQPKGEIGNWNRQEKKKKKRNELKILFEGQKKKKQRYIPQCIVSWSWWSHSAWVVRTDWARLDPVCYHITWILISFDNIETSGHMTIAACTVLLCSIGCGYAVIARSYSVLRSAYIRALLWRIWSNSLQLIGGVEACVYEVNGWAWQYTPGNREARITEGYQMDLSFNI